MNKFAVGVLAAALAAGAEAGVLTADEIGFAKKSFEAQFSQFLAGRNIEDVRQTVYATIGRQKKEVAVVDADELLNASEKNALAAKKKYGDKLLVIRGRIGGVGEFLGTPAVEFSTASFVPVSAVIYANAKGAQDDIAIAEQLEKGQRTAMICASASFTFIPSLGYCRFVKPYLDVSSLLEGDLQKMDRNNIEKMLPLFYKSVVDGVTMNVIATDSERKQYTIPMKNKAYRDRSEKYAQSIQKRLKEIFKQ